MSGIKYSVAIWKRNTKGEMSVSHEYQGNSVEDAEIIAVYLFAKKAIETACLNEKNLNPWEKKLKPEDLANVKDCHITVLEETDSHSLGGDRTDKPKILKSFGDKSVGVFPRYHLA